MFTTFQEMMIALPAVILALTQVFKKALKSEALQDRLVPVFALLLGLALGGLLGSYYGQDVVAATFSGGVAGLAGIGLYTCAKKVLGQ